MTDLTDLTDLWPAEQPDQNAPIYICANALARDGMRGGMPLDTAIRLAREAGADGFELRRELLPGELTSDDLRRIREALAAVPAPSFYSISQPVFLHGRVERESVMYALAEARALGCRLVKFAPGDTLRPDEAAFDALCAMLTAAEDLAPGMLISLENDQTPVSADLGMWARLFERAEARHCALGMTFDLGNWACLDVDVTRAARTLGRYVVYVHAKAVRRKGNAWVSVPFRKAAIPHPVLAYLPQHTPRAIEFPVLVDEYDALLEKLRAYVTWLRSGAFDT